MFTESKHFFENIEKEKELFKKVFSEKKKEGNEDNVKLMWNYSSNEDRLGNVEHHKRVLEVISNSKPVPVVKKEIKPFVSVKIGVEVKKEDNQNKENPNKENNNHPQEDQNNENKNHPENIPEVANDE